MSFLDPNHPIHPEHIPIIASIPILLGWLWFRIKAKMKKNQKENTDKDKE